MPKSLTPNQFDYAGVYVEGQRSSFRFRKPHLASFMSGMLVPLGDPIPVFPGVKLDLTIDAVIRSNTMVVPPLNGLFIDFFAVWVPHRIVWNHEAQFLGENDTTAWTQSTTYSYPTVPFGGLTTCTTLVNDTAIQGDVVIGNNMLQTHYGLVSKTNLAITYPAYAQTISVLPYRGYYACWNYLFRDENYQRPVLFDKGDTGTAGEFGYLIRDYEVASGTNLSTKLSTSLGTGLPVAKAVLMPVNKFHDAFTSVLPQPQFASQGVPLATQGLAPVIGDSSNLHGIGHYIFGTTGSSGYSQVGGPYPLGTNSGSGYMGFKATSDSGITSTITASNLVADLSQATGATINQLRTSIMYQRFLEALARGGRRMPEYMQVVYGIHNTKAMYDYPELISRSRYYLGINQVVATADSSGSGWSSHLGDTGAFSLTVLKNIPCCERDFTEFGYLHILYCVRSENLYSQAIQEHFTKKVLLDEYNPFFDHIGDVGIPGHLVNFNAATASNFGYQEAWWSERTQIGLAVGAMNKAYGSLSYWTAGEEFASTMNACTPAFLCFNPATLDAFFVSRYYAYPQFIIDACIKGKKIARMSQHSIPGIVGRI